MSEACKPRYSSRLAWDSPENRFALLRNELEAQGRELLDLTGTNPTTCGLGDWDAAIAEAMASRGSGTYRPDPAGLAEARAAIAGEYARLGTEADPGDLLLTASSSESYSFLFQLLGDPGDEVLVPSPSYPLFEQLAGLAGIRPVPYHLRFAAGWWVDFASLEAAISARTRAIVVVNPNNPTGSYLRASEADRLMRLCAERSQILIADEVFWEYPLQAPGDRAWFAGNASPECICVSLGGLSKSAGMPQMKLGWMLVRGPHTEKVLLITRLRWIADTYLSVSTPVQMALPALLTAGAEIRAAIQGRIRTSLQTLHEWRVTTPSVSAFPVEGGWSAILRLPGVCDDEAYCTRFLNEAGVWVQPGYFYDLGTPAHIVISLLTLPFTLREGLARMGGLVSAMDPAQGQR